MTMRRPVRYTLIAAAVVAAILAVAVLFFTRTEPGVERAGRLAVGQMRALMEGELHIERITSAGLLGGITLHGVRIDGPDGRPFIRADSARLSYGFRTFLRGAIVFDRLILHAPDVVIERLPGQEEWNYLRIFPPDTMPPDTGRARLILIEDIEVHDGRVAVRIPWEPEGPVSPGDTARMTIESVPGGLVRTVRFTDLEGRFPRIVWEAPEEEGRLIEVGELSGLAYVWDTPLRVEEMEALVVLRDSLISFQAPRVRLPRSELGITARIIVAEPENLYDVRIDGRDLAFADLQWLYPELPDEGGGALEFRIQSREPGSILWLIRDARLRTGGTEMAGSFGVVTGDTVYFTNVALNASPLDLDLLRRLVPVDLPIDGLLIGTIEVDGPISALETRGDVRLTTLREGTAGESHVRWNGTVAGRRPYEVRALTADIRGLDLEQVAHVVPDLRLRGRATGRVRATGSFGRGLDVTGDLALDRNGHRSAVRGSGHFGPGPDGAAAFDVRLDAAPVALELLVEQLPGLGRLAGDASGPVTVTGTLADLRLEADITTPAGGLRVDGALALAGTAPRFQVRGAVTDFQLHRVVADIPETVVTGRFDIDGAGDRPETVVARGSVEVLSASVAGVEVRRSVARGAVADGLVRLDSAVLATELGDIRASGTFGLVAERRGELAVTARARSLERLETPRIPGAPTPEIPARPELRLAGALDAELRVTGSLRSWEARGHAAGRDLVYDGLRATAAEVSFDGRPGAVSVDGVVDSVVYRQRRLAHVRGAADWTPGGGRFAAVADGVGRQQLDVAGAFRRVAEHVELEVGRLALVTDEGRWDLADRVGARVGWAGVDVDDLVLLRAPRYGRVHVVGSLPWARDGLPATRDAALAVTVDSVRIGELLRLGRDSATMDGVASGVLTVTGTALAPDLAGRLGARPFRYSGAALDSAAGEIEYSARQLRTRFHGWKDGASILSGAGTIPVDLALAEREDRHLDEPVSVRIEAERVPAGLLSFLAPGFREVTGSVSGGLAVVGTTRDPALEGELRLSDGTALFEPLDIRYRDVDATARMGAGRRVDLDARVSTEHGTGQILGAVDVTRPRDPDLDLVVTARRLDAARRRDVSATVTGRARVAGSYTRPVISGDVRLLRGEMNLDEIWRQYQIVQLDSSLFRLFDSTAVRFRPPPEIPFLRNLVLTDVTVTADRGFWIRSDELNVEVSGSLDVEVDRRARDLRLTGSLQAIAGSYSPQLAPGVPARTFTIRGGTVDFMGTPGIDPGLGIEAAYRVRRSQGDPIDVVARVAGTLKEPRVDLTSDSDLLMSDSDLASYILFGRSGAELTQAESDVLSRGIGLMRPVATGLLSYEIQRVLVGSGLPVDWVAFTTPEYGITHWQDQGLRGVFHNTQLEVGLDAGRDLSLVGSVRIPTDRDVLAETNAGWRMFGARVEWRFLPTWTTEVYVEDRFARTPSFGLTEIDDRKVWGLSLVRDWGY